MLSIYPACFFKDNDGYSVIFPDLGYLATCGDTPDEAMAMAVDCLAGYLYTCKKNGDDIPSASAPSQIDPAAIAEALGVEECESFVNMVSVDVAEYAKSHFEKSVKKTLTIPIWLNTAASEAGINFSQTLRDALIDKLFIKDNGIAQNISWESSQSSSLQNLPKTISYSEGYGHHSADSNDNFYLPCCSKPARDTIFSGTNLAVAYN